MISTNLAQLQKLIELLRAAGVTEFAEGGLVLKLGPVVQPEGAAQVYANPQMPRMSEDLEAAMKRLDPMYSDASLFAFGTK